ncbi:MAG: energy-coupling factor transporter ATPase, partial [Clostridia bacterium]
SGGQKQRVAIAGILAMSPQCIIFDEATAMLDPAGRKDIVSAMKQLNKEKGITVITITHHMNEAVEADRVVVLNKGKVFADGTPRDIFKNVKEITDIGLSVPQVTQLCYLLKKDGYKIGTDVLHTMEAAERLEELYKK